MSKPIVKIVPELEAQFLKVVDTTVEGKRYSFPSFIPAFEERVIAKCVLKTEAITAFSVSMWGIEIARMTYTKGQDKPFELEMV